jgi:hypothetical protein
MEDTDVKYPNIKVKLVGENGNAFAVLGRCSQAMKKAKCTPEQVNEFMQEATAGDYDHLLGTCMKYFDVE